MMILFHTMYIMSVQPQLIICLHACLSMYELAQ